MKRLTVGFIFIIVLSACNSRQTIESDELVLPKEGQTGIYYFRTPVHCESCDAIEQIIQSELNGKYAEQVESGGLVFRQFNLDDPGVADFARKFDVVFKSLLILKDGQTVNMTEEAFLYALPNPEKFKQLLEENLDTR
ncbi:nitrophenyl compound nitroreductase subunit ArsF family protein [Sunxiuqinia dokdonensis]|uniref:Thioredoxin domain-containing protein n=1 Tax=Sunxiuqinia dokdonensis TaxID=1409788 RepID=A0A0L8V9F6_9BACT|nr:nitrophenyl compound nitroreductase subunit ArsF family protein [Sunxiuqinia dokdonensis]KOH45081.1 hypothetical protein NC99_22060 [Sunxiuqinia dokdonensis]